MAKIDKKQLVNDAIKYSEINGIPSREDLVAQAIKEDLKDIKGLEFERDGLGSIAVIKKSSKEGAPTISFSSHMDEVGFIVVKIEKNGFIKMQPFGGWWGHVLLAQKLTITTQEGKEIIGIVGSTSPHLLTPEAANKVIKPEDMFVDIGLDSKEEVEKTGIQIGDMITPFQHKAIVSANENRVIGKAHDDRISVVAGINIMRALAEEELDVNVIFIGSVQEEVGLRGARTSSYKWTADLAFAIDVTFCHHTPGMTDQDTKLGTGVALSLFDSSVIGNPKLVRYMEDIAKEKEIPYTYDGLARGGTDSGAIHLTKSGIPTMTLSIPSRYMHSHVSMIDVVDVEATINLIVELSKKMNSSELDTIVYK